MAETPGCGLWIGRVKVGKQLGVRPVPRTGTSVGHGVHGAGDVTVTSEVAVVALVEGLQPE